tara:strand:- start:78 stop:1004 length:927 start_codon:yes stop_codon:yes gene_type:complete
VKKINILATPQYFSSRNFKNSKIFKKFNKYNLTIKKGPINNKSKLKNLLKNQQVFIVGSEKLTKDLIASANNLNLVVRFGTSVNNIDLFSCKKQNIKVKRLPKQINSLSVARHTLGFLLNITNNFHKSKIDIQNNKWERFINLSPENLYIGIIGMGSIGKNFSKYAYKLGFKINYYSRSQKKGFKNFIHYNTVRKLIQKSDIISLHLPLNNNTKKIFNKEILKLLKKKFLINTSRGELVDEKTLYNLLKKKYISGAALDVFEHEPPKLYSLKLRKLSNVISTPHNATYDEITLEKMTKTILSLIKKFI